MRTARSAIAAILLMSAPLLAQWAPRTDVAMPRRPDGTPDLNAPAPRTADGKVDFSGVWAGRGFCPGDDPRVFESDGEAARTPRVRTVDTAEGPLPFATCFDLTANVPGGVLLQPSAAALRTQRMNDNMVDSPEAHCLPLGPSQLWLNGRPREIVQTPRQLVVMFEANQGLRRIYTDGRALPNDDPQPWWYGYSVGVWEGDTLVVTTTHFNDGIWLDVNGTPLSADARVVERMRRPTYGTIDIAMTVTDPGTFTRSFTVGIQQYLLPDSDLMEFICNENERSSRHYVRP